MPKNGYGQLARIAQHIGVNPVVVTQVLKSDRDFNEEQGLKVADFLGLNPMETECFMRLLARDRAGTHDLKAFHESALEALRKEARKITNRLAVHRDLDDSTKSVFYSDWVYSATRLLTTIKEFQTPEALAQRLNLSNARINEVLDFLVNYGLCTRDGSGKLDIGIASTHLDAQSRFINNHHRNWRLKGLESLNRITPEELFYSSPCTLSREDFQIVAEEIRNLIASISKRIPDSPSEVLACVNIDWFKI